MTSINQEKAKLEGPWITSHILPGFEIDVDALAVRLPSAKVADAWAFSQNPMFAPGNRSITSNLAQELRGLINRWIQPSLASPVNGLMAFSDSTETCARCTNDQIWLPFWNLLNLLHHWGRIPECGIVYFAAV